MGRVVQMGRDQRLYVNSSVYATPSWAEVTKAKDVTVSKSRDKVDADTRDTAQQGYKSYETGLRDYSVKFQMLVPATGETNTAFETIKAAQESGDPLDFLIVNDGAISTDGLEAERVPLGVFGWEDGQPLNGTRTIDVELALQASDDQTYPSTGTTSDSAFVAGS